MNAQNRPILLAYDGSEASDDALAWAAETALVTHRPVRAVVVVEPDATRASALATLAVASPTSYRAWFEDVRLSAERRLKEAGVAEGAAEVLDGLPVQVLIREAEHSEMVVVGSWGHGWVAGVLLGSVSQHLARHASGPVVVVRPRAKANARRIVVGIDGSGGSAAALEFACARAELTKEQVVAVHAWRMHDLPVDRRGNVPAEVGQDITARELMLAESVAGAKAAHPDVDLVQEVVPEPPVRAMIDQSRTASLLVLGSRGLGAFEGLLLGSVTQAALHQAQCPVAVIR